MLKIARNTQKQDLLTILSTLSTGTMCIVIHMLTTKKWSYLWITQKFPRNQPKKLWITC